MNHTEDDPSLMDKQCLPEIIDNDVMHQCVQEIRNLRPQCYAFQLEKYQKALEAVELSRLSKSQKQNLTWGLEYLILMLEFHITRLQHLKQSGLLSKDSPERSRGMKQQSESKKKEAKTTHKYVISQLLCSPFSSIKKYFWGGGYRQGYSGVPQSQSQFEQEDSKASKPQSNKHKRD